MDDLRVRENRSAPGPSADTLARQAADLLKSDNRHSILRSIRKRSTSSRPSTANRAEHVLAAQDQQQLDGPQDDDDDMLPDEDGPPPNGHGNQASSSRSTTGGYSGTLKQVEEGRRHINGPHLLLAKAAVPFWLEETTILLHQKKASIGRHVARFLLKPQHTCVHGTSHSPVPVVGDRPVIFYSLEHCFVVNIPQLHCPLCKSHFEMPPVLARCFGSSVYKPKVYLDIGLLTMFHHIKMVSGMGDTLLCNAWNEARQYSWLHGLDSHLSQPLQKGHLGDTYRWWRNMFRNFGVPDGPLEAEFFPGAFGKCPACADNHPTTHQDFNPPGTPGWSDFEPQIVADVEAQRNAAERMAVSLSQGTAHVGTPMEFEQEAVSGCPDTAFAPQPNSAAAAAALPAEHLAAQTAGLQGHVGAASAGTDSCFEVPGCDSMVQDRPVNADSTVSLGPMIEAANSGVGVQESGYQWVVFGRKSGRMQKPLQPRRKYVTADGGHKLTHYTKCGIKHTAMWNDLVAAPMHARYFNPKLDTVYKQMTEHVKDLAKDKAQAAEATAAAAAAAAAVAAAAAAAGRGVSPTPLLDSLLLSEQFETLCQADLLAARSVAPNSKSAYTDIKVVVGCVCSHVVPGRGMFLSCPDEENFAAYDSIFVPALRSDNPPSFDALCIDVGCRYKAHFKHHHPVVSAKFPHVLVGWLHSNAGHNLSCQLKFCGMYYEGMGRCIGEQTEQLWAFMKPHAKTSRYMSLPHRSEYLDDLLEYFADLKYENIAELTCQTLAITSKQKRQLASDIDKIVSSPEGIRARLQRGQTYVHKPTTPVPADRPILYVKTLMELELQVSQHTSGRTNLAAMMSQPSGAQVTKARSKDGSEKIEAKLKNLEKHLGITQRWSPADLEYKEHFARLCAVQISLHQLSIEKEVSVVVQLTDHLKQLGVSCRQTEILDKRIRDRHKGIRELLVILATWSEQAGLPEVVLTETDVLRNNLPWHSGGEYKNCSEDFLRLKLYKMECDSTRCDEELSYLPSDAVKIMLYFGKQIRLLQAWLMKEHAPPSAPSGQVILMFDRMRKVERLYDDALAQFIKCKLVLP